MLRNIMAEIPKRKVKEFIRFSRLSSKNLAAFIPHPSSISSSIGVTALKAYRKVSIRSARRLSHGGQNRISRPDGRLLFIL